MRNFSLALCTILTSILVSAVSMATAAGISLKDKTILETDSIPLRKLNIRAVYSASVSRNVKSRFDTFLLQRQIKSKAYPVDVFLSKEKKYKGGDIKLISKSPEAYAFKITPSGASLVAHSNAGLYYGVADLIEHLKESPLYACEKESAPTVSLRGLVEGFYGTPWSHEARLEMIDFMAKARLNLYIYGPKDDPYHSSPHWRDAYPEADAKRLQALISRAKEQNVEFCWAIHPGKDIRWNTEDRDKLLHKLDEIYKLGARSFAVFFDDISGEGTDPQKQAELLNYIQRNFVAQREGVSPMMICPTEYNKAWSANDGAYLKVLGQQLDPEIRIMWTGDKVVSDISLESMAWINERIQRKALIWWNFPVTDYVRNRLLLGPVYGNSKDIAEDLGGFVSNPMEHPESSKIALYALSEYLWDMSSFSEEKAWRSALKVLMPLSYPYLEVFARNNSDLGPNTHGYRREESRDFIPLGKAWIDALKDSKSAYAAEFLSTLKTIQAKYMEAIYAADRLLVSTDNPSFLAEAEPWIRSFSNVVLFGTLVSQLHELLIEPQVSSDFQVIYYRARALEKEIQRINATENTNPYQPGIQAGSTLYMYARQAFEYIIKEYNQRTSSHLQAFVPQLSLKLDTSVNAFRALHPHLRGDRVLFPLLQEYFNLPASAYIGIKLDKVYKISSLSLELEGIGLEDALSLYLSEKPFRPEKIDSADLYKWTEADLIQTSAQYVYLYNPSKEDIKIKLKALSFQLSID